MNPRTTLIAAIVLAALGTYIYLYEREPIEDTDSELEKVFAIEQDDLREIDIRHAEVESLKLKKDGDSWQILAPVQAAADDTEVDTLTRNIVNLERQRFVAEGDDVRLEEFGLVTPEIEVHFKTEKSEETTGFLIGDETPTGTNRYAKLAGENRVFVISSYLKNNFDKNAWDLRDKKVLHFEPNDVERVVLKNPGGEIALAKASEDLWNVTTPSFCRADRYKASSLVSRLETAKMEEIVTGSTDDLKPYGLDSPSYEVDIQLKGGGSAKLLVGKEKEGQFFARNPNRQLVYVVGSNLVDDIEKDVSEYRSKRLFDYATYQVHKFQIVPLGGPARVYEKKTEGEGADEQSQWVETAPDSREWDRTQVEDFLYKMNGTDAEDFVEDSSQDLSIYGLDRPAFVITVWSKEGEDLEELTVGKPEGEWIFARRKGDEPLLRVAASNWAQIEKLMRFEDEREEGEKKESKE